jgi:hypothetical protein
MIRIGRLITLTLMFGILMWSIHPTLCFAQGTEVGQVAALEGAPVIIHEGATVVAKAEDKIYMGDTIKTPKDSKISITFKDGSIMNLGEDSEIVINRFVFSRAKQTRTSSLKMISGKLRVMVSELKAYRESRYELETPTAIIGIRGSDFIVMIEDLDTEGAAYRPLLASLESDLLAGSVLLAQQNGLQKTTAINLEGSGSITSKAGGGAVNIPPKFMGSVITGQLPVVQPAPPAVIAFALKATSVTGAPQTPVVPPAEEEEEAEEETDDTLGSVVPFIVPSVLEERPLLELQEPPPSGARVRTNFNPTTPSNVKVDFQD